jgi:choline dehydrogenase-like flavoprotein
MSVACAPPKMSFVTGDYDVIVGTGAGGGTLAHALAPSGKRIHDPCR